MAKNSKKRTYKKRTSGTRLPYAEYLLAKTLAQRRKSTEINAAIAGDIASLTTNADAANTELQTLIGNRRRPQLRGAGSYWTDAVREFQGGAGALLDGGQAGLLSHVGGRLAASPLWGKLRGNGAYRFGGHPNAVNQLMNPSSVPHAMSSVMDETGDIIICHSEYIKDIVPTSSSFQTQYSASINPGLAQSFPWLSQLAQYFEEYKFEQLVFEYRSVVTDGNNTASGTVIMATQYNPGNALFQNKANMENYEHANSLKVTDNALHGVECDIRKSAQGHLEYIRTGAVPTGQDIKTYDLGLFQLATSGANITASQQYGELWVHYTCRLSKTKVVGSGGSSTSILSSLPVMQVGGTSTANYFLNPSYPMTYPANTSDIVFFTNNSIPNRLVSGNSTTNTGASTTLQRNGGTTPLVTYDSTNAFYLAAVTVGQANIPADYEIWDGGTLANTLTGFLPVIWNMTTYSTDVYWVCHIYVNGIVNQQVANNVYTTRVDVYINDEAVDVEAIWQPQAATSAVCNNNCYTMQMFKFRQIAGQPIIIFFNMPSNPFAAGTNTFGITMTQCGPVNTPLGNQLF